MQFNTYIFMTCLIFSGYYTKTYNMHTLPSTDLVNGAQALAYCQQTQDTYIVIVWPRGHHHLAYIIEKLNEHGSVKYVQNSVHNKKELFSLYRKLHKHMSYKSAKKYFKPYIRASSYKPLPIAALVFHTKDSLEKIIDWKKEIRDYIGESYYSIHINDHYDPGTIEAAHAVFDSPLTHTSL